MGRWTSTLVVKALFDRGRDEGRAEGGLVSDNGEEKADAGCDFSDERDEKMLERWFRI